MELTPQNMKLNNKVSIFSLIILTAICASTLINITLSYQFYIETATTNLTQTVDAEKSILSASYMKSMSEMRMASSNDIDETAETAHFSDLLHPKYKDTNVVWAKYIGGQFYSLENRLVPEAQFPTWFSHVSKLRTNSDTHLIEYEGDFVAFALMSNENGDLIIANQISKKKILEPFYKSVFYMSLASILGLVICAYWFVRYLAPLLKVLTEKVIYNKVIFEKAPIPFVVCDKNNRIITSNDAGQKLFKISKEKMFEYDFTTLVPNLKNGERLQSAKTEKNEDLILEVFGEKLQVGEKTDTVYAIIDSTEKAHLENIIQESMAIQAATIDCLEDGVVTFDNEGNIINANPAIEKIFGYLLGEIEGRNLNILFSNGEQDFDFSKKLLNQYLDKTQKLINVREFVGHDKSGNTFPVEFTINDFTIGDTQFFTGILRDISLRKKQEKELIAHKDKLQELVQLATTEVAAIVKTAVNAIISIDSLGIIKIFNPAAEKMFGWTATEVVGKNVGILIPDMPETTHNSYIKNFIKTGKQKVIGIGREALAKRKDGTTFPAQLEIGWSKLPSKEHLFVAYVSDITEQKADRESLTIAKEQAEAANRAKAEFLANMSHEIRTPMNAIIGFTEIMLEDVELGSSARDNLTTIHGAAKSLLTIINDILDFSKVEARKLHIEKVPFHLPSLLKDVAKVFEHKTLEKGLEFGIQIEQGLTEGVIGDPSRLKQILLNLIGNAIKFTSKGEVKLIVESTSNVGMILFKVIDTGIGMTADQVENIFSAFSQADSSTARKYGGTGLGTTISKQLVELMNGRIWVDSRVNVGTDFSFIVELQPDTNTYLKSTHIETTQPSNLNYANKNKEINILLAEDVLANAKLIMKRFEDLKGQIKWVQNGKEAVIENEQNCYDIILMDVQMPEMDGIEATKKIRSSAKNNKVPIIALTASAFYEEKKKCLDAGMNRVVCKPVNFTELLTAINDLIESSLVETDAKRSLVNSKDSDSRPSGKALLGKVVDYDAALDLWQSENAFIETLVNFVESNNTRVEDFNNYLSAQPANIESALELAHKIKGVSANLRIKGVPDLMSSLEKALHAKEIEHSKSLVSFFETGFSKVKSAVLPFTNDQKGELQEEVTDWLTPESEEALRTLNELLKKFDPEPLEPIIEFLEGRISSRDYNKLIDAVAQFDFINAQMVVASIFKRMEPGNLGIKE